MEVASDLIQTLSAGADVATLCILFMLWKLEKRVFRLEIKGERDEKMANRSF